MIIRIVLIVFTAAVAWISHVANTGGKNLILDIVEGIPNGDKIGHFFVMGILAYLVNMLLECKRFKLGPLYILKGSLIVGICVLLEELTHIFTRTRTFSYYDLLSDFLGILAFSILAVKTYPFISSMLKTTRQERPPNYDPHVS